MVAEHQSSPFIRNDVTLSKEQPFMLITGPNMAGKSTVMRSVRLMRDNGADGRLRASRNGQFSNG